MKRFKLTKKGIKFYYKRNRALYIDRVILVLAILIAAITFMIKGIQCTFMHNHNEVSIKEVAYLEENKEEREVLRDVMATDEQSTTEQKAETVEQEVIQEPTSLTYRMTYYHPGDGTNSGTCTASGLCTNSFSTNSRGWYTYKGKVVVATAHESLKSWDRYANSTQKTYKLYDELTLTIEGQEYEAIVLDKCGSCMTAEKIDLFVKDRASGLDTTIQVAK